MNRPVRVLGLTPRRYLAVLAVLMAAAMAVGGWLNYDYARSGPGNDPYAAPTAAKAP